MQTEEFEALFFFLLECLLLQFPLNLIVSFDLLPKTMVQ